VTALVDELGIESYFDHLAGVLESCRCPHARCHLGLPDASISARNHTDNDCFEKVDVAVRVAMTVKSEPLRSIFQPAIHR